MRFTSAILCHPADSAIAKEITHYLSVNCSAIDFEQIFIQDSDSDLIGAAERALSNDYLLLLLSPNSVRRKLPRERWEPVLIHQARQFSTAVAYLLLQSCDFPAVFRQSRFFDLSQNRQISRRAVKRWLLEQAATVQSAPQASVFPSIRTPEAIAGEALEGFAASIADWPGTLLDIDRELALIFAREYQADFEAVAWIDCSHRTGAGILGDTAQAMGLTLRGPAEENRKALEAFFQVHRVLLTYDNLAPEHRGLVQYSQGSNSRASVIVVSGSTKFARESLQQTAALFSHWPANFEKCLLALSNAQRDLASWPLAQGEEWQSLVGIAVNAFAVTKRAGRLAEAYEFLDTILSALESKGDLLGMARWEWEKNWILEEWHTPAEPRPFHAVRPIQLKLDLQNDKPYPIGN